MAVIISDTFAGAARPLTGKNAVAPVQAWSSVFGIPDHLYLDGTGKLVGTDTGGVNGLSLAPGLPASADYDVSATVTLTGSAAGVAAGVSGRTSTGGGYTGYVARYNAGGQWEILRFLAGNAVVLGSYIQTLSLSTPYTVTLRMTGTTIKLLVDGVERISVTDSSLSTAGRAGLYWFSTGNTAISLDDFSVASASGLAASPIIYDDFVGAIGTPLVGRISNSGNQWFLHTPGESNLRLDGYGNAVSGNTFLQNSLSVIRGSPTTPDYTVSARMVIGSPVSGMTAGVWGRINLASTAMTGYLARYQADAGRWELHRFLNGASTLIDFYAQALTPGVAYQLDLVMAGSTIKLFVDGVERVTGTDTAVTGAGNAGLHYFSTQHENIHITDFSVSAAALSFESPVVSQVDGDPDDIILDITPQLGGTGPYTYAVHRGTAPNFTPDNSNRLTTAATFPYTDDNPLGGRSWYKVLTTDAATASVLSKAALAIRYVPTLEILFLGDSMTAATVAPTQSVADLKTSGNFRKVRAIVHGVNGSVSAGWVSGSANLSNALYRALSVEAFRPGWIASINIGVNDCHQTSLVSAATFKANCQSMASAINAAGGIAIFHMPVCPDTNVFTGNLYTEESLARLASYEAALDQICYGGKIRRGDRQAFNFFGQHRELLRDGLHPTDPGYKILGSFHAKAITAAIVPPVGYGGGFML